MSSKTRQISTAEWESHREEILRLRRSGISVEGKNGIIAKMTKDYSFTASPSQYSSQLNTWGQRKNVSANEWRLISQIADQFDEEGIAYQVLKNKLPVSAKTLKRKRSEHCSGDEYARNRRTKVSMDLLPQFVEFKTLNVDDNRPEMVIVDDDYQSSASASGNPSTMMNTSASIMKTPNLGVAGDAIAENTSTSSSLTPRLRPVTHGQGYTLSGELASFGEGQVFEYPDLENLPDEIWTEGNFPFETNEQPSVAVPSSETVEEAQAAHHEAENSHSDVFRAIIPSPAARNGSLLNSPEAMGNASFNTGLTRSPPFSSNEHLEYQGMEHQGMEYQGMGYQGMECQGNLTNDIQQGRPTEQSAIDRQSDSIAHGNRVRRGSDSSAQMIGHTQSLLSLQGSQSKPREILLCSEMVKSSLLSLLPPDTVMSDSLLSTRTAKQREIFGSSFYRLLLNSIESNFAGLEEVQIGLVLNFLKSDVEMRSRMTRYLKATPNKVTKALTETLIRAAIENGDDRAVAQQLVVGSLNSNEIVCTVGGRRYTAVERAAKLRNIEVTKVLLDADADPNKTYATEWSDEKGALELAVRRWGNFSRKNMVDIQLVKLLFEKKAKASVQLVEAAITWRDADLVRLIMSMVPPEEHSSYCARSWVVFDAIERLDSELATLVIKTLFEACTHTHCGKCPKEHRKKIERMVGLAAMRGFSSLVKFLAKISIDKCLPLACAVRSGREDIIEFMLEKGADVDASGSCIDSPYTFITTPLAEAIRARKSELIQSLENRGALALIKERSRFEAVIYAASEVGNLDYCLKIFQMVTDIDGKTLTPALNVSIINGHTKIALALLKAGADVNERSSSPSPGPPMLEALRRKNRTLVEKIMECDLDINAHRDRCRSDTPFLEEAARWSELSIIKDLLSMGADVNACSEETAVTAAVRVGNKALIDILVKEYGASLDVFSAWERSPLGVAITNQDLHMLQYLLELGADPSCPFASSANTSQNRDVLAIVLRAFQTRYPAGKKGFGAVALQSALDQEDLESLYLLLEAKYDVNAIAYMKKYGWKSALGMAMAKYGGSDLDIIRRLISAGGDVNSVVARSERRSSDTVWPQRTALLQAIGQKSKALVELLIKKGADIHQAARLGLKRTPLQYACEVGSIEIVELLLANGAQVDEELAVRGGGTSLQLCAIKGYCGIADKLLKKGANIHEVPAEYNGQTAFDGAATNGRLNMLMLLWDAGVCQSLSMEHWERAKKLAADNGHTACRDLLQELYFIRQGRITWDPLAF